MSISQKSSHQTHEAIVFFSDGDLIKEMLYTEFEALLDCVVPMRDFAGREMQAAYVRLDSSLAVVGVVLFLVNFDKAGFPEQSWNVPLRMLAEAGARGPDLGGGPARLATRSQCPVAGYADSLWDIQFGPAGNTLDQLRERLHGNRLGIDAVDLQPNAHPAASGWAQPAPAPAPSRSGGQPAPGPSAAGAEGTESLLAAMQQSNQQIAALRQQHQLEMLDLQRQFADQQQRQAELQQRTHALENEKRMLLVQVEEHAQAAEEERVRGERKLQLVIEKARAQTAALRHELQHEREAALTDSERRHSEIVAELNARTAAELADRDRHMAAELAERDRHMQEELARLERERQLHEEQLVGMRTELTELRRDKLRLMDAGADQFFASLQEKGVKFVSFQPGAGHLTIPMEDLYRFIEDTPRYVAEKCKVSEEQYLRWLAHYNNPVCQGSAGHGGTCGKPLTKLLKPGEFVAGLHDRCDIHKQVPRSQPRDTTA